MRRKWSLGGEAERLEHVRFDRVFGGSFSRTLVLSDTCDRIDPLGKVGESGQNRAVEYRFVFER